MFTQNSHLKCGKLTAQLLHWCHYCHSCKSFPNLLIWIVAKIQCTLRWWCQANTDSILHYLQRTWPGFRGATETAFSIVMPTEMNKLFHFQQSGLFSPLFVSFVPDSFRWLDVFFPGKNLSLNTLLCSVNS